MQPNEIPIEIDREALAAEVIPKLLKRGYTLAGAINEVMNHPFFYGYLPADFREKAMRLWGK